MSEMIPYPSSSVWYIRVSSKGESGQGSGVGIRLRMKGVPGTEVTFILTCAHVIRRLGKNDKQLGPKHGSITVYPAGYGYNEADGIQVTPVAKVIPLTTLAVDKFYDQPVDDIENADWALLAFADPKWSNSRTGHSLARRWFQQELKQGDLSVIAGYPNGKTGFAGYDDGNDNIVRPKPGYVPQTVEKVVDEIITFDGTHSRPGMSGGGVFRKDGENYSLCGLHRARHDENLQLKAVSVLCILQRLNELGYEPVEIPAPTADASWYWPIWQYLSVAPQLFKQLQIDKGFIPPSARVGKVGKEGALQPNIIEWFTEKLRTPIVNHSTTLLLGGYGSGKSSVLHVLARDLALDALSEYPSKPVPIYCRLDVCRDKSSLADGIVAYLFRYAIKISRDAVSQLLNDPDHHVVLLLDGLDEYCNRVDYQRISKILEMLEEARGLAALKLVISCRDTFFPSSDDVAIVQPDTVVNLAEFSDDQVSQYLQLWKPPLPPQTPQVLETSKHLKDVCRLPIHLFLFCEYISGLNEEGVHKAVEGKPVVSSVDLYDSFTVKALSVDEVVAARWTIAVRRRMLRELAFHWHAKSISEWTLADLQSYVISKVETPPASSTVNELANSFFNCSFFIRIRDRFRFSHKSFQEFLIAEAMLLDLLADDVTKWQTPIYTEVFNFGLALIPYHEPVRLLEAARKHVLEKSSAIAQASFVHMYFRSCPPHGFEDLQHNTFANPSWTVRHVCLQAIGVYRPNRRLIELFIDTVVGTGNSVFRTLCQAILHRYQRLYLELIADDLRERFAQALALDIHLRAEDAAQIIGVVLGSTSGGLFISYRGGLNQTVHQQTLTLVHEQILKNGNRHVSFDDARWSTIASVILLLGVVGDLSSYKGIRAMAELCRGNSEVWAAFEKVAEYRRNTDGANAAPEFHV
jgi:hypothetical protein